MSNILKALAIKAADKFAKDSPSYEKLLRFSPHWLRHLSASRQDLAGISFTNIMSNLRHQNESTTRLYVHAEDHVRHQEMEKLRI
jgi:integrase